jgi:N-acetylglucosamine kinase-like BadF-type ATPase
MQKYAIAASLLLALATPALAAEYYIGLDTSTNKCQVVAQQPDGTTMKMVGSGAYSSEADAQKAIQSLNECNG